MKDCLLYLWVSVKWYEPWIILPIIYFVFLKLKKCGFERHFGEKDIKFGKNVLNIFFFDSLNENKIFLKSPDYFFFNFFFSNIYVDIIIEFWRITSFVIVGTPIHLCHFVVENVLKILYSYRFECSKYLNSSLDK